MSDVGTPIQPLASQHCEALPAGAPPLSPEEITDLLRAVRGWEYVSQGNGLICKTFVFADFGKTMAFVNAVAWIAHREDHHPDMHVGYGQCQLCFSTHSIRGISMNDFICAAKIEALL